MKTVRSVLSGAVIVLLGLGYAGSQIAALSSIRATLNWSARIDSPPVAHLALALLALAMVFAFLRDNEEQM